VWPFLQYLVQKVPDADQNINAQSEKDAIFANFAKTLVLQNFTNLPKAGVIS
jgi:hypothetical protein